MVDRHEERGAATGAAITDAHEAGRLAGTSPGTAVVAAAPEEGIDVAATRAALEFDVLRNALMHTMRQRWFDALHRWLMFLIVLFGTAGVATLTADLVGPLAFAAATALLATLDLVLDLRTKSRLHDDLRRRYYLLLAEIAAVPDATAAKASGWQARMLQLTAEEPDLYRVIDCVAYNAALLSLGRDPEYRLIVPWWRRQLGHVFTFPGFDPVQRREIAKPDA